jgi:hypothetical protein
VIRSTTRPVDELLEVAVRAPGAINAPTVGNRRHPRAAGWLVRQDGLGTIGSAGGAGRFLEQVFEAEVDTEREAIEVEAPSQSPVTSK